MGSDEGGAMVAGEARDGRGPRSVRIDPLWSRALRALLTQPTTALAVVLAVAVAALVAASAPLYEASLGNEVLRRQIDAADPMDAGLTMTVREGSPDLAAIRRFEAEFRTALPIGDRLGEPVLTMDGTSDTLENRLFAPDPDALDAEQRRLETADPPPWEEGRRAIHLFAREGATDHLDVVWASGEPGLWVPDNVADQLGIEPGHDVLYTTAMSAEERTVGRFPVAGVYRDLWDDGLSEYWRAVPAVAIPNPPSPVVGEHLRRHVLIAEPDVAAAVAAELGETLRLTWQLPALDLPTRSDAAQLRREYTRFEEALIVPEQPLRDSWERVSSSGTPRTDTDIGRLLAAAADGQRSVAPLLRSLSTAGVALALAVIAVTGAFVTRRRAAQVRMLWAQGVGPWAHGLRSAVELAPAAVIGAAVGWAAALAAIRFQAPWRALEASWIAAAGRQAALAGGIGLVTLLVVAAGSARAVATDGADTNRVRLAGLAALVAVTTAAWLGVAGTPPGEGGLLLQAFPLLAIAVAGSLGTVGLAAVLARWPARFRQVWADLAFQRLRTSALSAAPLVMASAVAIGLIVYATGLASSTTTSTREKALAQVGARSAVQVAERYEALEVVPDGVHVVSQARSRTRTTGGNATVLVVDADRLAADPTWGPGFSTVDLDAAVRATIPSGSGGPLTPLVAAGPGARPVGSSVSLEGRGYAVAGVVVQVVDALPAMGRDGPTYLVDRAAFARPEPPETIEEALDRQLGTFRTFLWSPSDAPSLEHAAVSAGLRVRDVDSIDRRLADPRLLAQLGATDFVRMLGATAVLVAIGALLLYGASRQRERIIGYALSRRMGLTTRQHRWALTAELMSLLALAALVGLPAALFGLVTVLPSLDPLPGIGPPMAVTLPLVGVGVVSAALLVIGLVAAVALQRRAEAADVAEVLRVAA